MSELTLQNENEIAESKREAWGSLGVSIYQQEQNLIKSASEAVSRLKTPTSIEEVPQAEVILKNVKAEANRIQEERKEITSRFDSVTARLMQPEKSLITPIADYSNAIIKLKQDYEKSQLVVKEKQNEIIKVKEYLLNEVNSFDAISKSKIQAYITQCYAYCLGAGNISTVGMLDEAMVKMKSKFTPQDFIYNPATPNFVKHISEQEYAELVMEIDIPVNYVELFLSELTTQFANYELDYQQKESALAIQKAEAEAKQKAIEKEQKNKNVLAKLEAQAVPALPETPIKELKKSYQLDLEENMDNAWRILGAFIATRTKCEAKLRIKNAFNLSVGNMAKALESCKNDDNRFDCNGLIWKEISKL